MRTLLEFPFLRLVAHFVTTIFKSGDSTRETEVEFGLGGILGILAVPGAFLSFFLFDKYSSLMRFLRMQRSFDHYVASIPDKYFFLVFSMAITGIVVMLKWEKILPGRQDYLQLAPLPVSTRTIFLANLTAIVLLAAVFAIDVNFASTLIFPMIVTAETGTFLEFLAFVAVHGLCAGLASAFTFFAALGLIGMLMAFLPQRFFHQVSIYLRIAVIVYLLALLVTSFSVPRMIRTDPDGLVQYLPPAWFLGLYQKLQNHSTPVFDEFSERALWATAIALGAALVGYAVSYSRYFLRIPERAELSLGTRDIRPSRWWRWWPARLWPTPFDEAVFQFCWRTLWRSPRHCLVFGGFVGLGFVLAVQTAFAAPAGELDSRWLSLPLILAFFVISGLRLVFEMPATVDANWIYQVALDAGQHRARAVGRLLMLCFLLPFLWLPTLAVSGWAFGWVIAIEHTVFVVFVSLALAEIFLFNFRKIPFACTFPGFERHAVVGFLLYAVAYFICTSGASRFETWLLASPARWIWAGVFGYAFWYARGQAYESLAEIDTRLLFEETGERAVERLNLQDR